MRRHTRRCFTTVALAALLLQRVAAACPMCKGVIAERASAFGASAAVGFYWSILVLLAMPFVLIGGMTWLLARAIRRQAGRAAGVARE